MTGSNEVINPEIIFPECQKRHIFMLLMCAGGFMGAFTGSNYYLRNLYHDVSVMQKQIWIYRNRRHDSNYN